MSDSNTLHGLGALPRRISITDPNTAPTDAFLAEAIRSKMTELDHAIEAAMKHGLCVTLKLPPENRVLGSPPATKMYVSIVRPEEIL